MPAGQTLCRSSWMLQQAVEYRQTFCSAYIHKLVYANTTKYRESAKKVRNMNWNFKPQWNWLVLLAAVLFVPLLLNLVLSRFVSGSYATYIIQPAFWVMLAVVILRQPPANDIGKARMRPFLIKFALGVAFFQVYLMVVAGFFNGFGKSPYSFTFQGILDGSDLCGDKLF